MGLDLTDAEAEDQGSRLITAFELIIRNKKEKRSDLQPSSVVPPKEVAEMIKIYLTNFLPLADIIQL